MDEFDLLATPPFYIFYLKRVSVATVTMVFTGMSVEIIGVDGSVSFIHVIQAPPIVLSTVSCGTMYTALARHLCCIISL